MTPRRYAILKVGTAYRETRNARGDFDRMLVDLLTEPGQRWEAHDVEHGAFPSDPAVYDGFVITGGRYSAYDDLPWLKRLLTLIREIHGRGQALLGICLGHQALAQALGGEVKPNPRGWDVGVREVTLTPAGSLFSGLAAAPHPLRVLELHQDIVTRLPPGAVHLATSGHTPHEMFALGARTLGIQGHPEFDADVIRVALGKLREGGILTQEQVVRSEATLAQEPDQGFLRLWLRDFLRAVGHKDVA